MAVVIGTKERMRTRMSAGRSSMVVSLDSILPGKVFTVLLSRLSRLLVREMEMGMAISACIWWREEADINLNLVRILLKIIHH